MHVVNNEMVNKFNLEADMAFSSEVFVARLVSLCEKRGITPRRAMAEVFRMDVSNLVKWRNKESIPKASLIYAVAQYFDVSADYLLGRTENESGNQDEISAAEWELIKLLRQADDRTREIACASMRAILKTETEKK